MSLHNGIDTVAIASLGIFSETYGVGEEGNTANLVASVGYLEDAPTAAPITTTELGSLMRFGTGLGAT